MTPTHPADVAAPARPRRTVVALLGFLGGVAGIATVTASFGRAWWVFDLTTNFRPLYAVVLVVAGAGLLAVGRRRMAAAALLAAGLNAVLVAPYLAGRPPVPPPDAPLLEVVSFNVGISTSPRGEVMAWIDVEDPDVVFLFESSFEWEDAAVAAGLPLDFVSTVPAGRIAGVTVLARPSLAARPVDPGLDPSEAVAVDLEHAGGSLTILGLHPPSPTDAGRAARRDTILGAAGDWVRERTGPVLVVGDLNATPWSVGFRELERRGGLTDSLRGRGLQPTWPAGFGPLMIPIDHALHTGGLAVADRRTGPSAGSAHRPLVVSVGAAG
ncbi:MAG: endonuclease/exonuclease/phosphatase family protein [Acidimicrobiia bacterium]|nr:endonuclease/exonuclease/phosphatase family protein [Acidimicrobiia bacterium]